MDTNYEIAPTPQKLDPHRQAQVCIVFIAGVYYHILSVLSSWAARCRVQSSVCAIFCAAWPGAQVFNHGYPREPPFCFPRARSSEQPTFALLVLSSYMQMNAARSARSRAVVNAAMARLATSSRGRKIVRDPRKAKVCIVLYIYNSSNHSLLCRWVSRYRVISGNSTAIEEERLLVCTRQQ